MPDPQAQRLTRYQITVLAITWLGWLFDSMDATIYTLVVTPALRELLGTTDTGEIGWYTGVILTVFLLGWALGGIVFGVMADRFGRVRALVITILIYAVFTGMAGLSHTWWELALYRFLTALGIGGEWAAGASLIAEVWPERLRVRGAGLLQSAWAAGYFVAAALYFFVPGNWRLMFFLGIVPAVIALLARMHVHEPERWRNTLHRPRIRELFGPAHRRDTIVGVSLAFVAVFGLWGATNWTPSLIRELLAPERLAPDDVARRISYAIMALNAGALLGYLVFPFVTERIGRRAGFVVMLAGAAVSLPATFLGPHTVASVFWMLPVLGFFTNGIFSGFPVYLPELYPTRIRATGAGFCFNAGRVLAAAGPFTTGYLIAQLGSYASAASAVALIYCVGVLILLFARETRGQPLPD